MQNEDSYLVIPDILNQVDQSNHRPALFAVADGEQNVRDTVATITVEPKRILSMVGAPGVQNVGRGILISKATL